MATNQYTFSNIARLVSTCINEKKAAKAKAGASWNEEQWKKDNPDWDKVMLIPVSVTFDSSTSSNSSLTGVYHDLKPAYAKLEGGVKGPALKIQVTYTSFND